MRFPQRLPNHNRNQVFYYDDDLLQRRVDYLPEVTGAPIAHYTHEPRTFDGLVFYTHRTVHLRDATGRAAKDLSVITIDTESIHASHA